MRKLLLLALAYCGLFHYAYVAVINPVFEYAYYLYNDPSVPSLVITYACAVAPLIWFRNSALPSNFGASILYVICYAPAQMMLAFILNGDAFELAMLQILLAISMAVLFVAARSGHVEEKGEFVEWSRLSVVINAVTLVSMLALLVTFSGSFRLVSFEDVYDLRSSAATTERGFGVDYLLSWLTYSLLPYYFSKGFLTKNKCDIAIGFTGSVLLYAAMGAKSAILLGPMIYCVGLLYGSGKSFMQWLLMSVALGVAVTSFVLPDDGLWVWARSLLLVRIIGTGGWTMATYYEYFTTHQLTYYTHIGPINAIFQSYPYGENSLGQIIGLNYAGSTDANFNANFWASDAFAALGMAGIPMVTIAAAFVFFWINRLTRHCPSRLIAMWLTGFWLALLNLPLSVAVLSGGGLITILLIQVAVRKQALEANSSSPAAQADPQI